MANTLIGNYIASGACGSAFEVVGHPDKVLKIIRLMNYKSPINEEKGLEIGDFESEIWSYEKDLDVGWAGGIALNEFQAVLFNLMNEMKMNGDEDKISPHLPKLYGFTTGEMKKYLLNEIDISHAEYNWNSNKYLEMKRNFTVRNGDIPGTRIGLLIMERVTRAAEREKDLEDNRMAKKQILELNDWLLKHNFIVRDSVNAGNWGFRDNEVVWFDIAVSPYPMKYEWKVSADVKLKNMWYGFEKGFGGYSKLQEYEKAIEDERYINKWWQAEEKTDIIQFLAESEIIGKYLDSGMAGAVFAVNGDKVLKIVRLNHEFYGQKINENQSDFIEDIYIDKLKGETIPSQIVDIQHYNKGKATEEMTDLINSKIKGKSSPQHKLKTGENIALWIMERIPTIGQGTMGDDEVFEEELKLHKWGSDNGWRFTDLHNQNYGQRADGSYVAFDMWPHQQ